MVATRYGRPAAPRHFGVHVVTEIKAVALGANCLYPEVKSVLDMSGQDTKAVLLNDQREVTDFEMNDKCAAGTGKFLEVMARALGLSLDEFNTAAFNARSSSEEPLSFGTLSIGC